MIYDEVTQITADKWGEKKMLFIHTIVYIRRWQLHTAQPQSVYISVSLFRQSRCLIMN